MGEEYIRQITVLGSVPSLGRVMMFDEMEDFLKWTKANGAGDSVLEKSQTLVYNKDYSLHVKSRTTAAAEDDEVYGYRLLYQRPGKRYRFECLFAPDAAAGAKRFTVKFNLNDGARVHNLGVSYDAEVGKWQYMNSAGTWSDITGGAQSLLADKYHRLLFEWDENEEEYTRFICDGLEKSLVGVAYQAGAQVQAVGLRLDIGLVAGATPPGEIYVDDVFVMEI